jgi:hypothetical protein
MGTLMNWLLYLPFWLLPKHPILRVQQLQRMAESERKININRDNFAVMLSCNK